MIILRKVIKPFAINIYKNIERYLPYHYKSYSQAGEDMILRNLMHNISNGFYVDIGAHHPFRFSNTHYFYCNGWRGINIDPLPGCMDMFNKYREDDINLEVAVFNKNTNLNYFQFDQPAHNTFDKNVLKKKPFLTNKLIGSKGINTYKLCDVLDNYLPKNKLIDFCSIDVEGLELEVLSSNNWEKYRPHYVLVEDFTAIINNQVNSEIISYMKQQKYEVKVITQNNIILEDKS